MNPRRRSYEYGLDALLNSYEYKIFEKLSHIMINKKGFPVIVFHPRSIFPTGELNPFFSFLLFLLTISRKHEFQKVCFYRRTVLYNCTKGEKV